MFSLSDLPLLNAFLNTASAVLLYLGHRQMKKGNIAAHRQFMISVFVTSSLFLLSYLLYHFMQGSQPFRGEGWIRPVYFAILLSHTVCAATIVPLAILTLRLGLRREDDRHARIAKWTYPIWCFVSVTGVVIYLLLYQLYPSG
jgi:uncharacterized membrane protein YozB (DUF420 family)